MPASTKRRPRLPQFYLRYFSNAKEQLRAHRTSERQPPYVSNVKKAVDDAAGFAVKLPDGLDAAKVESDLSEVEAGAKKAMDAILSGKFPPPGAERRLLARWMMGHVLSIAWQKQPSARVFEHLLNDALSKIDREDSQRHLGELGLPVDDAALDAYLKAIEDGDAETLLANPDDNAVLRLHVADHAAQILMQRYWLLGISATGGICTGDRPVLAYAGEHAEEVASGEHPEGAEQVYFPLGRRHVLALSLAGSFREEEAPLSETDVDFVNSLVARASDRFVFQHPEDRVAKLTRRK
ncbi:MAG TPA: DUF4238 domain-containing protein [Dehalococcoidia bacterium]|nr:DUF4238 domain-containing protein [Dehalococcoidia bacterium]